MTRSVRSGNRRVMKRAAVIVAIVASLVAPARSESVGSGAVDGVLVERGRGLYVEHYCGVCHALAALGSAGIFGPPHDDMGRVAELRVAHADGRWADARAYLRESIVDPRAYLVPGWGSGRHAMPAYVLEEDDLSALVEFLLSQRAAD
jgi:mono/diheme cytochrome c family protein